MNPGSGITRLRGQRCWYLSAGGPVGSSFVLVLGEKIKRTPSLKNPAHSTDYRENRGEFELTVWCSWRLQDEEGVYASSDQSPFDAGSLSRIIGKGIVNAECSSPAWDLRIEFSDGTELIVFCDHVNPGASIDQNWELFAPFGYIGVGPGNMWGNDPEERA